MAQYDDNKDSKDNIERREDISVEASKIAPIENMEQFIQFLKSIDEIKAMDEQQKYAHSFLIVCKFLDLVGADNNLISEVSINLMISAVIGEVQGNIPAAQQMMRDVIIPMFGSVSDDLVNIEIINLKQPNKPMFKPGLH